MGEQEGEVGEDVHPWELGESWERNGGETGGRHVVRWGTMLSFSVAITRS